jgi:glycosyltransferase involved in cell wall biosynthesis
MLIEERYGKCMNECEVNEKISIIVPVYNVKPYLDRCVMSLKRQVYKNIEIILVDDGSNDGSSTLCDEIALSDMRIRVIHKKNGGLSDARNVGFLESDGELITFVDSDDWVSEDYISMMYENMKKHAADISGCSFLYVKDNKKIRKEIPKNDVEVWDAEAALRALLQQDGFTTSAWGLLIKRQIFEGIVFPIGSYYEDLATIYKVIHRASIIVHSNQKKYFYYKRTGSIQNEKYSQKHYSELYYIKEINEFIKTNYPNLEYAATEKLVGICFHLILMMNHNERKHLPEAEEMIRIIKKNRLKLVLNKRTSRKVRGGCVLSFVGIDMLDLIYRLFDIKGRIDF